MSSPLEHIGPCELCGSVDHHLIEGVCRGCRQKCHTLTEAPDELMSVLKSMFITEPAR
jgi:NMD protein affecting ribosome stability and mRNA decay